jgi:hypothetical protein
MADAFEKISRSVASAVAEHSERRREARYGINADTEVEELQTQAKVNGRTTDLGLGGCYVDALTAFPSGTNVQVRIKRGGQTFEANARVLYGKPGMGMGMAFLGMGQEEKIRLEAWIRELSGDSDTDIKQETAASALEPEGVERIVLQELITSLQRRGLLTQSETEAFRRKLDRTHRNT